MKMQKLKFFSNDSLLKACNSIVAIIIAFIMGGLMVLISGDNPLEAYGALLQGAFGSVVSLRNTIRYTIPIIIIAYSFALTDKCGFFNISQESQMYGAALAMVMVSQLTLSLPSGIRIILMAASAIIASSLLCILPAIIKFKLGVSEVVVGVMMNYLMSFLSKHMIAYSFIAEKGTSSIMSKAIPEEMGFWSISILIVILVVIYQIVMKQTVPGFRLRVVGQNPVFAEASGIKSMKVMLTSAAFAGGLIGICAISEMLGYYHLIYSDFALNVGFNGMTAALLGNGGAIGMILGALLLGALKSGSVLLSVITTVPTELVDCVQGFVMFFATITIFKPGLLSKRTPAVSKGV